MGVRGMPDRPTDVLYLPDIRRELRCGRHLALRIAHQIGVRIGARRLAVPRAAFDAYVLRRAGEESLTAEIARISGDTTRERIHRRLSDEQRSREPDGDEAAAPKGEG
jgi:hypothetical protein